MSDRQPTRTLRTPDGVVVGAKRRHLFLDIYHLFLAWSWPTAIAAIVGMFLGMNLLFSFAYWLGGGVTGAQTWADAYAFSVQTMATIGYGGMSPQSTLAHVLVIVEAVAGLLFTALSTGLIFSKFTLAPNAVVFAARPAVNLVNGQRTLCIRVGNERGSLIVDATARLVYIRTETTAEGMLWYHLLDLPLHRAWTPAVTRGWTLMHALDEASPLFQATAASVAAEDGEFLVTIAGLDQTTRQPTHALHRYEGPTVAWGQRHKDMTHIDADGTFVMDVRAFDELVDAPLAPSSDS